MPIKYSGRYVANDPMGAIWGGRGYEGRGSSIERAVIDRRDLVRVPVGIPISKTSASVISRTSVPPLVIPGRAGPILLRTTGGREPIFSGPVIQRRLPVVVTPPVRPPPVAVGPSTEGDYSVGGLITDNVGVKDMGLDLGQLVSAGTSLYGAYRDIRVANATPVGYDMQGLNPWSNVPLNQYDMMQPSAPGGILPPPVDLGGGSCGADDPSRGWVYKKVCGQYKWVKQKRRRRKVLLTESDYDSLLRIQSLKVNQNMTVALAKTLAR